MTDMIIYPWAEGKRVIFVFGSNQRGIHGAGAALHAKRYCGAIQYRGKGIMNNCYAIPTKDWDLRPLPLEKIKEGVNEFIEFARTYEPYQPDIVFRVTAIGTGYAGYSHRQIAPMFEYVPPNCYLPAEWEPDLRSLGVELGPKRFIRR